MTISIDPMDAALLVAGLYGQIPLLKPRQVKRVRTLIVKIESAARAEAAAVASAVFAAYVPPKMTEAK